MIALVLALSALVVAAFWAALASPTNDQAGEGRLVAAEPTIDLGRVPFDRVVEARFVLENTGAGPLRITAPPAVRTLEGC